VLYGLGGTKGAATNCTNGSRMIRGAFVEFVAARSTIIELSLRFTLTSPGMSRFTSWV
jgi:hypothetical protein